jgi:hypothetical protein
VEGRSELLIMRDASLQYRMAFANLVQRRPERGGIDGSFDFRTKAEVYRVDLCLKMEEILGAPKRPEQT